mmetsp:Transcript_4648/g.10023  ORF Transcript_4648/g.10023 Transcript_4648/m.10023 type:complete len:500 (-) Transcript_4648:48-1547(-)
MAPRDDDSEDEEVWGLLAGTVEEEPDEVPAPVVPPTTSSSSRAAAVIHEAADLPDEEDPCEGPPAATAPAQGVSRDGFPTATPATSSGRTERSRVLASKMSNRIPADILEDTELNAAIDSGLPKSHSFEVHRTIWRLRRSGSRHVGLQMPEGLQQYALTLADLFRRFVPTMEYTTIMGDVTFGACCIDDLGARAVGVDFLVHYGHSCIVPTDQTTVATLYIHVEVDIDVAHLVETVRLNFTPDKKIAFMGTVQFTPGTLEAVRILKEEFFTDGKSATVPQVKPLSIGETLGCTSPAVSSDYDAVVFVCDGRFHLESAMIQNPHIKGGFYRYDPFYQSLTRESFGHGEMHEQRRAAIEAAGKASMVGLILSTLGRQGSSGVLEGVERLLLEKNVDHITVLLSDVSPERLAAFGDVDCWVQVACPRLSIDWGDAYDKPLLTPYEAHIVWGDTKYQDIYPMDYYSNRGGPWSNYGAPKGHGGSLDKKFRQMGRRRLVEYDEH